MCLAFHDRRRSLFSFWVLLVFVLTGLPATILKASGVDKRVREDEARRIAVIEKVSPSVVAVFAHGGHGGGTGVLISTDGYALTNYHVVQGPGPLMQCGLPDGVLYDAVLVGQDKVGDVALIKLLPKKEGAGFPFAVMGDSDKVKAGDWSLAMGNPFLLATDFTPTVTFGLISGVHRYQYPEGSRGLLEYTDCIQFDTSINPGNSGGPLFNMSGEIIGINGRGSFDKRGRVNSGVGYAISINQIKNFLGLLKAGHDADHATLGAFIENRADDAQTGLVVSRILEEADVHRRGLDLEDELVTFANRPITNRNHFQNVLGIYPKGWRVPLVYRHKNEKREILVRLMGHQIPELDEGGAKPPPGRPAQPPRPLPNSPARKFYQAKKGFANYYFTRLETDRLWNAFQKHGNFLAAKGTWVIEGEWEVNQKKAKAKVIIGDEKEPDVKAVRTIASLSLGSVGYTLDPLKTTNEPEDLKAPVGSGGLLMALYQYRRLLIMGEKGFEQQFAHAGTEPFYPIPPGGAPTGSLARLRTDAEVLNTEHAATQAKWFFSPTDHKLQGAEVYPVRNEDPCELYFYDYRPVSGLQLPHIIEIRHGDGRFGLLAVKSYQFAG